jgi:hypothetical protein
MPVDTYTITFLDPFGQTICSMTYLSFAPEDDNMNFFTPLLGDKSSVVLRVDNPQDSRMAFQVRIERS